MIKMRLGGSGDPFEPFPQKPRRMHWRTYERLREQARAADDDAEGLLAQSMPGFKELPPAIAAPSALGPYLNVFLVTQQHWSQSEVGVVTTIGGLLGLAVQTPIGAAIDETRAKRGAIVLALAVLGIGAVVIFAWPTFWPVLIANSLMAIVGDVFGPAVAAVTLGLYTRSQLARRMGRNSAFDHAGNVAIALVAGGVGYAFSQRAVFLLVPVFAVLASIAVLSIPVDAIDYNRARDLDGEQNAIGASTRARVRLREWKPTPA
jgi:MFS family permease